jgi:hypothetical protein
MVWRPWLAAGSLLRLTLATIRRPSSVPIAAFVKVAAFPTAASRRSARRPTHQLIRQERRRQGSRFDAQPQLPAVATTFRHRSPSKKSTYLSRLPVASVALLYDDNTRPRHLSPPSIHTAATTLPTPTHTHTHISPPPVPVTVHYSPLPARRCSCTVIRSRTRRRPPAFLLAISLCDR